MRHGRGKKQGHRSNRRGTLRLDVRTPIGRIARASGTMHLPTLNKMTAMIQEFGTQEPLRLDILRGIRDRKLDPLIVYDAYVRRRLDQLPTAETMSSLLTSLEEWLPTADCGDKQREAHRTAINYVKATGRVSSTVADLPGIVRQVKLELAKESHAAQFNRVRSSLQRYLRDTLGRRHELYEALADIEPLEETKQRKNNPQTVAQVLELARKIAADHVPALWGMALTGMGPKEFFDGWRIVGAGVHVPGTKRKARDRMVPLVMGDRFTGAKGPTGRGAEWQARLFADAIRKASNGSVQPYDLRRTYATWMEAAQIPRTRRRQYLGHSLGDVTDIYEQHEVEEHLAADAAKLEAFVKAGEKETLKLEGRQA
jgi:integrase